jgi:uncharacterized protein (DUF1015 family)
MAFISPFKGYYFDNKKVNLEDVIVPPYDVITREEREEYRQRSPYNMVHGILSNGDEKNKYLNAKKYFDMIVAEKVLIQDRDESFYVVEQTDSKTDKKRVFFLADVDLTQYKKRILPHEKTFEEPKKDRKLLLKTVKANVEIPFVLYSDLHRIVSGMFDYIMKGQPLFKFLDVNEINYTIWRLTEKQAIRRIQDFMESRKLYIADGHHRIESGYDVMRESGAPWARKMMMALANYNDEEKEVLPTHRLVYGMPNLDIHKLEKQLTGTCFDLSIFEYDSTNEEIQLEKMKRMIKSAPNKNAIGMYVPQYKRYYVISLKDPRKVSQWVEASHRDLRQSSGIKKQLDVTWLHNLILEPFFGIDTSQRKQKNIDFVKGSFEDAIKAMARNTKYQLIFFLNPTGISDIISIAEEHDTVPQKTTYFYPKVDSGLIIQKLV